MKILMKRNVVKWNGHEVKNRNDLIHCFIIYYYICIVNKLMYDFLDNLYPTIIKVDLGNSNSYSYRNNDEVFNIHDKRTAINSLCSFFSITMSESAEVFYSWLETRPLYVKLENSTTDIFVPESMVSNNQTVL